MTQWNINLRGGGKLETLAMMKLGLPGDLMGKFEVLDHQFFSNGLWLHCTLSNLRAPNFNIDILDVMQAEKEYMGPYVYFKDCVII